ncbi:hypothetical protein KHA80_06445 [Anaerobacillus sp. HL2]|nr:hypothetical protein KHA80_06445 [Anaerobacillus sp. HL2]
MLGTAPTPPSSPTIIEPTDIPKPRKIIFDYAKNLEDKTPQMQDNPALRMRHLVRMMCAGSNSRD